MNKNINHFSHKKSKATINGKPKLPSPDAIVEGEIAVNFAEGVETLSIKNESGTVVTFSSDEYYTEQKLGDSFTGENSGNTVTSVLTNYYTKGETSGKTELSTAFNEKADKATTLAGYGITDAYTKSETSGKTELSTAFDEKADKATTLAGYGITDAYTKSETSGKTEISSALNTKADVDEFTAHTANTDVHFSGSEKENLDSLATNIEAISGITSTKVSDWDDAAEKRHTHDNKSALDSITGNVGTMAYENANSYSSATEVNTALGTKVSQSDFDAFSSDVDSRIAVETNRAQGIEESLQNQINEIISKDATVSLTVSPSAVFADGTDKTVIFTAKSSPTKATVVFDGGSPEEGTQLNYNVVVNSTTPTTVSKTAEFTVQGVSKGTKTATVWLVFPIYYGAGASASVLNTGAMTPCSPLVSPSFTQSITTEDNDYIFFEVPNNMSNITKVQLFDDPNFPTDISIESVSTTREGYKAFKTVYARLAGTHTYKIS